MATPSSIPANAPRDTVQLIHRVTREKRSLWYQLSVLQQPERARACGAGSKAHSDRRPVDPPPVVELRVIEGETVKAGKDITFDYNANFLLFASLENSRPVAHGRVQTPAAQSPPILTGVPVSGMAYLDRPISAGYFIFPDLSIRHEGNYRLNFHLFEETKEDKDADLGMVDPDTPQGFDFRMEIKTDPFQVFSAKKFPGLMESTSLSKCVADQGCRVRIRRDVRMRKRDNKHNNYERREENYAARAPRAVTPATEDPHAAALRARSLSNSSQQRAPYESDAHRRPSVADSNGPPPPPGYDTNGASRGHLTFGDPSAPQYAAPRQPSSHMGPVSPGGPYTPTGYATPTYSNYQPIRPVSRLGQGSVAPMGQDGTERRTSTHVPPSPGFASMDTRSRRDSGASYPSTPVSGAVSHTPVSSNSSYASAPLKIASLCHGPSLPIIEAQTEPDVPPPVIPTGGKRKADDYSFGRPSPRLHNGQRPQELYYSRRLPEPLDASYSRADGKIYMADFNTFHY
ncbi:velvet factor domain-containing protein [Sarocladium implicatum]|nr:velvet factor domain-containing protein [Sarocladium implicatum]